MNTPSRSAVLRAVPAVLLTFGALAAVGLSPLGAWLRDRAAVQAWIASYGVWAPLAALALGTLQVVGLPLPASVTALVNGYLFGPLLGAAIGLTGSLLGMLLAIALARYCGRPILARVLGAQHLLALEGYAGHRNLMGAALIAFLVPGIPDNLIFFALGLGRRPMLPILALALVLRLPAALLMPYLGAHFLF